MNGHFFADGVRYVNLFATGDRGPSVATVQRVITCTRKPPGQCGFP